MNSTYVEFPALTFCVAALNSSTTQLWNPSVLMKLILTLSPYLTRSSGDSMPSMMNLKGTPVRLNVFAGFRFSLRKATVFSHASIVSSFA